MLQLIEACNRCLKIDQEEREKMRTIGEQSKEQHRKLN